MSDKEARTMMEALRHIEHSAMSWRGFNLFGDRKSIDELNRLMHCEDRMKWFENDYARRQKTLDEAAIRAELVAALRAFLRPFDRWSDIRLKEMEREGTLTLRMMNQVLAARVAIARADATPGTPI